VYTGKVLHAQGGDPIPFAYVSAESESVQTITDDTGTFQLKLTNGQHKIRIRCLGFQEYSQTISTSQAMDTFYLRVNSLKLPRVDVVAQQKSPVSSTTHISQNSIEHLQAISVYDALQLLPGNLHTNPKAIKDPTYASIRAIGANYSSSLGTAVMLDGVRMDNNATMQHLNLNTQNEQSQYLKTPPANVGTGMDLRQLSTDHIASIDIIKGIPSVEYGDLTTGAILITTKAGVSPWRARLKSTGYTRLAAIDKGFLVNGKRGAMNISLDYAQNHADLRSPFDTYKRLTGQLSYSNQFLSMSRPLLFNVRLRTYQSLDDNRTDPDTMLPEEAWSLEQKGFSANVYGNWQLDGKVISHIKYQFSAALDQEQSYLNRYISSEVKAINLSRQPGLNEGLFLPAEFLGEAWIDGLPVRYQGQLSMFQTKQLPIGGKHQLMAGVDYKHSENKGDGKKYAPYPINKSFQRPRNFSDIPALRTLSLYAEESLQVPVKGSTFYLTMGIRGNNMQADGLFKNAPGWHFEPRFNGALTVFNHPHRHFSYLNFRAGMGQHSQTPPLAFLYPAPTYVDLVSLMHYSNNADARTVLFTTHILDETRSLKPASNLKKEIGVDFTVYGIHSQITYYQEELKNGYSQETDYTWLSYRKYDTSGIDTDSKPDPAQLPYSTKYHLARKGQVNNKNRLEKTGIEYRIDFGRIHPIYTDIIVDGAWKKTLQYKYINEYAPSVVSTRQIEAIGHYHDQLQNTLQLSQFSSKLHVVTHVPQLRWVFSGSFQFIWIDKMISQF